MTRRLIAMTFIAVCTMATVPVLVKATAANEITIAIARLLIAALVFSPFVWRRGNLSTLNRKDWIGLFVIGLVFAAHWLGYFLSIKLSTASLGALAISTFGVQYLFLAKVFNRERSGWVEWCAVIACLTGCAVVVPELDLSNSVTVGLLVGVFSGTLYACLPLLHQRIDHINTTTRAWGQFTFALLCVLPFLSHSNWQLSSEDYYRLLFLGLVSTVVAHGLWVKVTTELPAIYPSVIYYLYVPIAMASSALLLGEELSTRKLIGAALILGASTGVTIYRLSVKQRATEEA